MTDPLILTHWDLDGAVAGICMANALRRLNYDPPVTYINYNKIDQIVDNLLTEFKGKEKMLLFLDFRLEPQYIRRLCVEPGFRVVVVDHHEWTEADLAEVERIRLSHALGKLLFKWDQSKSGCLQTHELTKTIGQYDPDLDFLVHCANIYDLWKEDEPEFKEHCLALNEMFFALKPEGFVAEFDKGYPGHLSPKCAEIWQKFEAEREHYMNKAMTEGAITYTFPSGRRMVGVIQPEPRFINLFTIYHPEFSYFFVVKQYDKNGEVTLSVRMRNGHTLSVQDVVEIASQHFDGVRGGGHIKAGGLTCPAGVDLGDFFETVVGTMESAGA